MPSPEHDAVVDLIRSSRGDVDVERPLEESRAELDGLALLLPVDPDIAVTPVDADGVACEWVAAPGTDIGRAVLYLHGGAYTQGSLSSHRSLCGRLSRAAGAPVLSVGYRLAPEHPHPAAVDDALVTYRWLVEAEMAPARVAFAGDSAGGGLALATLVAARDAGVAQPAGAVLISPWVDLTLAGASMDARAGHDPLLSRTSLARNAGHYAADADLAAPLVSPLFADLAGLAPLLVLVGTAEVLLDDAVRLADRAREAGVEVDLHVHPDLVHVWPVFAGVPEAEETMATMGAWVAARTTPGSQDPEPLYF